MSDVINVSVTIKKAITVSVTIANTVIGTATGNATVENSDASKSVLVPVSTTLVIPSSDFKLSDIVDEDFNLLPAGNGVNQTQRDKFQRIIPLKTGQTTSFVTGDDGDLENGRGVAFLTLDDNNEFGNTSRFTDTVGGQDYDGTGGSLADYVIDHLSSLAWFRLLQSPKDWPDAIQAGLDFATHFTDWRVPNKKEFATLINDSTSGGLNYSPFSILVTQSSGIWTSTTKGGVNTRAFRLQQDNVNNDGSITSQLKTMATFKQLFCRNHY